jgi:transposase
VKRHLEPLPPAHVCAGDAACDSDSLQQFLIDRGTIPVIPNSPTRKRRHPFHQDAYKQRNLIERMFCHLKDWRRIATRYDKLATNFAAAVLSLQPSSGGPDSIWSLRFVITVAVTRAVGQNFWFHDPASATQGIRDSEPCRQQ